MDGWTDGQTEGCKNGQTNRMRIFKTLWQSWGSDNTDWKLNIIKLISKIHYLLLL